MMRLVIFIILLSGQFCVGQGYKEPETVVEYLNHSSIKVDEEYFHKEGYSLPVIISGIDSLIIQKINARLKEIFHDQAENGSLQDKLKSHLKKNVSNYISIYGTASDTTQFFARYDLKPILKEKDYKYVRCGKNTLVFLASFDYEAEIQNYSTYGDTEDFYSTYYEQLYFNLLTGTEYVVSEIFDNSKIQELNKYIVSKANDKIINEYKFEDKIEKKAFLHRYQYDEEHEDIMVDSSIKRELILFDIRKNGLFVPNWFSFQLHIPEFSSSTLAILGKPVTLRITFDELKDFLNPTGPFGYLQQIKKNSKINLRNIDNPPINYNYNYESNGLTIAYQDIDRAGLEETIFRKIDHTYSKNEGKKLLFKKVFRSENGLINKIEGYGIGDNNKFKMVGESIFIYDNQNNLIKLENGNQQVLNRYDEFQNLIYSKTSGGDHEFEDFYKYYQDFYVKERLDNGFNFNVRRQIYRYDRNQVLTHEYWGQNSLKEHLYFYNELGNKTSKIIKHYNYEKIQNTEVWEYNTQGKVSEYCYDGGDRFFYKYDDFGNLVEKVKVRYGENYENAVLKQYYEYGNQNRLKHVEVRDRSTSSKTMYYNIFYEEREH